MAGILAAAPADEQPIQLGSSRELFIDHHLIASLQNSELRLSTPVEAGVAFAFDRPWEGAFCGYVTIIKDGPLYRAYYRGLPVDKADGSDSEVTCVVESRDGLQWTKPELGLFEVGGTTRNNVVLAKAAPCSHNFSPFVDARPGVPASERFKALAGTQGLIAFTSADGIRWRKLRDEPVIGSREFAFDSQNVGFWSSAENCYLCYFRSWRDGVRRISRVSSKDFIHWSEPVQMEYSGAATEHLYTNQTHPYFRAPDLYIALAARFMPGRQVISDSQAAAIHVHPGYYKDCSDVVLLTSRGGDHYDRTFMEGFVRPGIGLENWTSRTNYPALNVVPTSPNEMSFYIQRGYGQPGHHLRRYTLRTDGFASVHASFAGGEMITHPLIFSGSRLVINFATSAAGSIRVELQDASGKPLPGFSLAEAAETIGNEIERVVHWKSGSGLGALAGRSIRLRFVMKDADLYALWFQ